MRNKVPSNEKIKRQNRNITIFAAICSAICLLAASGFLVHTLSESYNSDFFAKDNSNTMAQESTFENSVYGVPCQTARTTALSPLSYPFATIILSADELASYCSNFSDSFDFGNESDAGSFKQIAKSYGESFFKNNMLVLVAVDGEPANYRMENTYQNDAGCLIVELSLKSDTAKADLGGGHIIIELAKSEFSARSAQVVFSD